MDKRINIEAEREAFEAEVRKVNDTAEIVERWPGGAYKHHGMEGRWQGWLMFLRATPPATGETEDLPPLPEPIMGLWSENMKKAWVEKMRQFGREAIAHYLRKQAGQESDLARALEEIGRLVDLNDRYRAKLDQVCKQAGQVCVKTWQERLFADQPDAVDYVACVQHELGARHKDAEIADLRAELASRSRAEGGHGAPDAGKSSPVGAQPNQRESAAEANAVLERAAEMLEGYAKYCYRVKPAEIEEHPYIPSIEEAAEELRALAASPAAQPVAKDGQHGKPVFNILPTLTPEKEAMAKGGLCPSCGSALKSVNRAEGMHFLQCTNCRDITVLKDEGQDSANNSAEGEKND